MKPILHTAAHVAGRHSRLSPRRGWELMRSRSTPLGLKVLSLCIGIGVTAVLFALEFPLEGVLAAFLPLMGLVADVAVDGLEVILVPLILASCVLSLFVQVEQ